MPLRSLETSVWRRLYRRFNILASIIPGLTHVGETIVPVTQADDLLRTFRGERKEIAGLAAGRTARALVTTVPQGERWKVYWGDVGRTGGDNEVSLFEVLHSGAYYIFARQAAPDAAFDLKIQSPFPLGEGDSIHMTPNGAGVAISAFVVSLWIDVEATY